MKKVMIHVATRQCLRYGIFCGHVRPPERNFVDALSYVKDLHFEILRFCFFISCHDFLGIGDLNFTYQNL